MARKKRFSARFSLIKGDADELIREEAPESIRCGLLQILERDLKKRPGWIRSVVCDALRTRPDPSNWSEYPNISSEAEGLVYECEWFRFYDIVEGVYEALEEELQPVFQGLVNDLFIEEGVGWTLANGEVCVRGDEAYEQAVQAAAPALDKAGLPTAASELREAFGDLSRRPGPDLSGAVHHAMAALEAVARQVSGQDKSTLGEIVKRCPDLIPKPLDEALAKVWGYASEQARHGRESRDLAWAEVQMVVGLSAVLCSYLLQKVKGE